MVTTFGRQNAALYAGVPASDDKVGLPPELSTVCELVDSSYARPMDRQGVSSTINHAVACHDLGAAIVVAFSGGPDSTVLAHAVRHAKPDADLHLAFVDHGNRSLQAELRWGRELSAQLNAMYHHLPVTVAPSGQGWEAAAREARYTAFWHLVDELSASALVTGHTASDQAETVLMRLIRGDDLFALAGIPQRRGRLVRPLLNCTRADVDNYLASHGLLRVDDPTNASHAFFRNRIRHTLMPLITQENPNAETGIASIAEDLQELVEFVDSQAHDLLKRANTARGLDLQQFVEVPDRLRRRVLAKWSFDHLACYPSKEIADAIAELTRSGHGSVSIDVPGGKIIREYSILRFVPENQEPAPLPKITIQGAHGPYEVRPWQPGDRMRPKRLKGRSRKLSDLYTDAKIPKTKRYHCRVVIDGHAQIVWAEKIGYAIDAQVSVSVDGDI